MSQKLISELTLKLNQQVSGPAAEARKALASVDQALAAISKRREADQRLAALVKASEQARARVRDLANQLMATETPTKRLMRAYEAATQAADKMAKRVEAQKSAMARAEQGVRSLIGPTESLAYAEQRLARDAERSGLALIKATAEEERVARRRRSLATEMARAAKEESDANLKVARSYHERREAMKRALLSVPAGSAVAAGLLASPVGKAMSYEQKLTYMASTMAGGGTLEDKKAAYGKISDTINKALIDGGGTREDAASALNTIIASGKFSDDEALAALGPTVKTAHAAGASAEDIAKTAVAMRDAGVAVEDMQKGFDMMLRGGQLGSFELRDMARWLPQQLALAKGAGLSGLDAIKQLVAINQVVKDTAGTQDEAGNNLVNLLQKLTSRDLQGAMAKAVEPQPGDPVKSGESSGKKKKPPEFDWQGYMIEQQKLGVSPLEAFAKILDRQLASNERYQELRKEYESADTPEKQKELLKAATDIAEASALGEIVADRQALMAALALLYGKNKKADLDRKLGHADGAVQSESDFVRSQTWSKAQDTRNAVDRANEQAYEVLSKSLGNLLDQVNETARAFPYLTAGLYGAAQVLAALGVGGVVGGVVGGLAAGGGAAGATTGAAAALGGAGAGLTAVAGRTALAKVAGPIGVAALVFAMTDKKGNLWGLREGVDNLVQERFGFNPSNIPINPPGDQSMWGVGAYAYKKLLQEMFGFSSPDAAPAGIRYPWHDPPPASPPTPSVAPTFSAPPAAPEGQKSGEDLGSGMADGLERQSSLIEEQARKILAAVQDVMRTGVDLPVRLDASSLAAQTESVRASVRRQANSEVAAMLRATYADTERG